ncbi:MAG: hypothetical protein GOMPHAMPRED_000339 [Gomphillus americanus]|uniref:Uncharacterized protein n=1 Tax=Gomphillus americanus TaxID=1940652 RepID=A0A8H3EDK5_9LECA|nr:MAG: hypothetical protein GOMPHAMPRED_000339 [Gomphillus americanus]
MFQSLIQPYSQFVLILNALDECPESSPSNQTCRRILLENLNNVSRISQNLKLLAISRHLHDIELQMIKLSASRKSMSAGIVNEDIKRYIANQLAQDSRLCSLSPMLKQKIEASFIENADGMFRWAYLQMKELKNVQSARPSHIIRELTETVIIDASILEGFVDFADRGKPEDVLKMFSGLIIFVDDEIELLGSIGSDTTSAMVPTSDLTATPIEQKTAENLSKDVSIDLDTVSSQNILSKREVKLAHFSVKEYLESPEIP